jgi:hypothetical protein
MDSEDPGNLRVVECPDCGSRTAVHDAGCEQQRRELSMVRVFVQEIREAFLERGWLLTEG